MMKRRNFYLMTLILVTAFELGNNTHGQHIDSPRPAKRLRVAVAQIPVVADIGVNIETIAGAIDRAVAEKAEILLTPEGSLSGYTHKFHQARVEAGLKKLVAG